MNDKTTNIINILVVNVVIMTGMIVAMEHQVINDIGYRKPCPQIVKLSSIQSKSSTNNTNTRVRKCQASQIVLMLEWDILYII